jgi:hypothetical protein
MLFDCLIYDVRPSLMIKGGPEDDAVSMHLGQDI